MLRALSGSLGDLAGLFLPDRCAACSDPLLRGERSLCLACLRDLPRTRFHDDEANRVQRLFWGRVPVHAASSFLHFVRGGRVQHILHRLKYQGDRNAGTELGRRMAEDLLDSTRFRDVDTLMAVPLHPRKERSRGYNQSQVLVDGMHEEWPIRVKKSGLLRVVRTSSQTRRGRLDRWLNVKEAFVLDDPQSLRGSHVLLVDDVITTGATLEGCVRALSHVPEVRVSIFTAACA